MKNKKFRLLWPTSKCCLKKFLDLQLLAKYGPIVVITMFIAIQVVNIFNFKDYAVSFFSLIVNLFFLVVILTKLEYLKIDALNKYVDTTLKIMIFVFLLSFIAYLGTDSFFYKYIASTLSFLGAYFIFLLLKKESI